MINFNSANCIEKNCFSHSMPCIKFVVESKFKNIIGSENPAIVDPGINIQPVNIKHFFCIA